MPETNLTFHNRQRNNPFDWDSLAGQTLPISSLTVSVRWRYVTEEFAKTIIKNSNGNSIVLDVGAGDGSFYSLIKDICRLYVAVEPSGKMAKKCKNNFCNSICRACGEYLPYRNGVFDSVVFNTVLDHCYDPALAVDESYRVLRPAGKVFFLLTNEGAWYKKLFRVANRRRKKFSREHNFYFDSRQLKELLQDAGFSSIAVQYFDFLRAPKFLEDTMVKLFPGKLLWFSLRIADKVFRPLAGDKGGSFICMATK